MGFIKERIIYEGNGVRVYIHQCYNPGRKTNLYMIRRDDKKGLGWHMGFIRFDGAWRQYIFVPEPGTKWSAGCSENINKFLREVNEKWRKKKRLKTSKKR